MKVIPKKRIMYPMALEREYSKRLVHYVDKNMEIIKQFLPDMEELLLVYGVKMDADSATLTHLEILMDRISSALVKPEQMRAVVENMARKVDRHNQAQWDDLIKSVLGMPMREIPFDRIIRQDAEADDTLREMWVQENLDYISNIDEQTKQKIKTMLTGKIVGNVNRRELSKELIAEIEKITQFERNRAVLIARDQVGKLNGRLMQYRQTHAGITQYKWSSSHDQRVRPSHQEYDGKIYDWEGNNTAPEGSPGIPIRCRCVAIPVIDLDKIVTKPVPQSYTFVQPMDYMSHTFKPQISTVASDLEIGAGDVAIKIRTNRVKNSQFIMWADKKLTRRDTAIRVYEKLLRDVKKKLPVGYKFPQIVITDIAEKMGTDAIGGFDSITGRLVLSSKYDTEEKILEYVTRFKGSFANNTVYAPILHELGHKYYYDLIKRVVKTHKISYNKAKAMVDDIVADWSEEFISKGTTLDSILSEYADTGYLNKSFTEIVAEAYSVSDTNKSAKNLLVRLERLINNDVTANKTNA